MNKYHCDSIKVFDGLFIKKPQISYLHGNNRSNLTKFIHPSDKDISYMKYYLRKNSNLVPVHLKIAIGCKVMLLKNIDSSAGLVNGRIGFVENIMEHGKNGSDSPILLIKFKNLTDDGNEDSVEIIRHLICETDLPYCAKISFYQYPIKLCYGVTAHKVQGQTLKKVAINISKDAFAHGSFYVALSRVKNLADVRLFSPEKFPEEGPLFHNNGVIQAIGKEILNNEEDNTND